MTGAGPPDRIEQPPDRSAPIATGGARPATRGFLFADLRDYTAFVERRGDHAAAALLERYRILVRHEVASFAGAEIRTEGDSFYVVFDSASAAVRCGLAIIAAAGATAADPDPIHVGVGVHAGETVETGEGYVGAAVNIAARLCSQAKAGELIVSDTVRALTRTYLDVTFEPLGARRLKGLDEPMTIYRVVPASASGATRPRARRSRPRRTWYLAGIGAAALVVVLHDGRVARLTRARGVRVAVDAGRLWVTVAGVRDDVFLGPGDAATFGHAGTLVVESDGDAPAVFRLERTAPARATPRSVRSSRAPTTWRSTSPPLPAPAPPRPSPTTCSRRCSARSCR